MKEEWRNIDELHMISNTGIVKKKARNINFINSKGTLVNRCYSEKILKSTIATHGYEIVSINGVTKYLHRLLAEAFIANPGDKKTVNHIDGNKLNNNLSNLEWSTYLENNKHAKQSGLNKDIGETHHNSKLKNNDVQNIKFMIDLGYSQSELAREYNINPATISGMNIGRSWKHIKI